MLSRPDSQRTRTGTSIPGIVRRHAEEVATRWWRRAPVYIERGRTRFDELVEYDQSIDAHLDGLKEAGQLGLDVVNELTQSDAPDASADYFAALMLAFLNEDDVAIKRMLGRADGLPEKAHALEGVFAWNDAPLVTSAVEAHLSSTDPHFLNAALAQCHAHGLSGGDHLLTILAGTQPSLIGRAIRTAGECGRVDLLPIIEMWLDHDRQSEATVRYWAAWTSVLLGRRGGDAISTLKSIVQQQGAHRRGATLLLCLSLPKQKLVPYLQSALHSSANVPLLLEAAGWSGHTEYVPWLIEQMRIPPLARLAGEAFRLITGFEYEENDAFIEPAPLDDSDEPLSWERAYPCPDADKITAWWQANQGDYEGKSRLFLGNPMTLEWLNEVLDEGEQSHRELAALHRVILRPGSMLIPTRAHAMIQWFRLQKLKESQP